MNVEELIDKNKILEEENKELKEKLKKYTAPARHYFSNTINLIPLMLLRFIFFNK